MSAKKIKTKHAIEKDSIGLAKAALKDIPGKKRRLKHVWDELVDKLDSEKSRLEKLEEELADALVSQYLGECTKQRVIALKKKVKEMKEYLLEVEIVRTGFSRRLKLYSDIEEFSKALVKSK